MRDNFCIFKNDSCAVAILPAIPTVNASISTILMFGTAEIISCTKFSPWITDPTANPAAIATSIAVIPNVLFLISFPLWILFTWNSLLLLYIVLP